MSSCKGLAVSYGTYMGGEIAYQIHDCLDCLWLTKEFGITSGLWKDNGNANKQVQLIVPCAFKI